jgi:hypothetical protein
VNADFTADTSLDIDFTPRLKNRNGFTLNFVDAINGADFQTSFTASAVVGIDDCHFLRQLLSRTGFSHDKPPRILIPIAMLPSESTSRRSTVGKT